MRIPGLRMDPGEGLAWRATRVPGVSWIPLHLDERPDGAVERSREGRRGGATVLIRMEPGCGYQPHRHVGPEDVLVLAGGYADELGTYRRGDHVHYPPGSVHAPRALGDARRPADDAANPACILYSTVPEGIELLRDPEAQRG